MALMFLIGLSAILFIACTAFCRSIGLFDQASMGYGLLFSMGVYATFWFLPTLLCVGGWFVYELVD